MSRILPRYTQEAIEHDPLEIMLAQAEAKTQAAIDEINAGRGTNALPGDYQRLRGLPVVGLHISGASPGTSPHVDGVRNLDRMGRRPFRR